MTNGVHKYDPAFPQPIENQTHSDAKHAKNVITVAMMLPGASNDNGFMQSGYDGLRRAQQTLGFKTYCLEGIKSNMEAFTTALRELAHSEPDIIIAHGGQTAQAVLQVAAEFPNLTFVVTQASITGPNVSSYEVLQEESAWLAGVAAGLLTKTNVVGHMSGIRPVPGLKGRAAFIDGVNYSNPAARVLTNFCGEQDDIELSRQIAAAEIENGADFIFTMLNAGRPGVTQAMAQSGNTRHFGNVKDYTGDSNIFAGSAVADSGVAVFNAVEDFVQGRFVSGSIRKIGLENPQAVRLTLATDIPIDIQDKICLAAGEIINGVIKVKTDYEGPEFVF